jgi:hypothetical protein
MGGCITGVGVMWVMGEEGELAALKRERLEQGE